MTKMNNPNKALKYHIITNPISSSPKIISDNELINYYDRLMYRHTHIIMRNKVSKESMILKSFIGDLKYAKYKLFEYKIENIKSSIANYIRWNTKPNSYHSQKYYDKYYKDLYSMEKHIEKLTKLMKQYESDNPHMLL